MSDPPDESRRPDLVGKRVLIVEDEFRIALDIERVLESAGVEAIASVSRNRDALGALQNDRFDVAILDLKLNGDDSLPVAERLSELGVPFIFLTGASKVLVPDPFRTVLVVSKPFDSTTLLAALRQAIGRSQAAPDT